MRRQQNLIYQDQADSNPHAATSSEQPCCSPCEPCSLIDPDETNPHHGNDEHKADDRFHCVSAFRLYQVRSDMPSASHGLVAFSVLSTFSNRGRPRFNFGVDAATITGEAEDVNFSVGFVFEGERSLAPSALDSELHGPQCFLPHAAHR